MHRGPLPSAAAAPLFRISGSALVSEEITFPRFSGLADTASVEPVLDRMLAYVRSMMREARALDPLAAHACRALQVPDDARIAALARRLEVSARTLERRFVAAVGLTPKRYSRIARMQRSLASLALPGARAIDVAHALGFTDQAHLTRELVALAGVRPAELLSPM